MICTDIVKNFVIKSDKDKKCTIWRFSPRVDIYLSMALLFQTSNDLVAIIMKLFKIIFNYRMPKANHIIERWRWFSIDFIPNGCENLIELSSSSPNKLQIDRLGTWVPTNRGGTLTLLWP